MSDLSVWTFSHRFSFSPSLTNAAFSLCSNKVSNVFSFLLVTLFIAFHVFVYLHKSKYIVNLMKLFNELYLILLCINLFF